MRDQAINRAPAIDAVLREAESRGCPMVRERAAGERGHPTHALARQFGM